MCLICVYSYYQYTINLNSKIDFLVKRLDDLKILNVKVLDLKGKSSLVDYMIIGTGTSNRQIESAISHIRTDLKNEGEFVNKEEKSEGWILLDLSNIIIHLFTEEQRQLYRFEEIWK